MNPFRFQTVPTVVVEFGAARRLGALLREAFAQAGLPAEIEVYAGAMHGWCPPDSTVYHEAQAERAWNRLLALFENALT